MQAHLAHGLAAAQAAEAAIADDQPGASSSHDGVVDVTVRAGLVGCADALREALDALDEPRAQAALDRLLTDFTVETVLRDALLPYLHGLGERWAQGTVSVAQEHFASHVVRGRMASLARGWGNGRGPHVILACPPGELHDLGLLAFGIVIGRSGWRVGYLGMNMPLLDLTQMVFVLRPSLVVLAATTPAHFTAFVPQLLQLAALAPLALAGEGATPEIARSVGARLLTGDPVTAAERLAGS
jgi:methanogenic corrinoid protein MtbC1